MEETEDAIGWRLVQILDCSAIVVGALQDMAELENLGAMVKKLKKHKEKKKMKIKKGEGKAKKKKRRKFYSDGGYGGTGKSGDENLTC